MAAADRCTLQIGGLLLRLVMETAMVKVPGKVRGAATSRCCRDQSPTHAPTTTQVPGEPEYRPAFEHSYIYDPSTERRHGAVQWHDSVPRIIDRQHEIRESLHPRYPPMLVRPLCLPAASNSALLMQLRHPLH